MERLHLLKSKIEMKKTFLHVHQISPIPFSRVGSQHLFESVYNKSNFEKHFILFWKRWRLTSKFKGLSSKKLKGHPSPLRYMYIMIKFGYMKNVETYRLFQLRKTIILISTVSLILWFKRYVFKFIEIFFFLKDCDWFNFQLPGWQKLKEEGPRNEAMSYCE